MTDLRKCSFVFDLRMLSNEFLELDMKTLILLILVSHTSKLNYGIIVNTVQCDSICRYLLPLLVSVS
jgi:hypothetical protein